MMGGCFNNSSGSVRDLESSDLASSVFTIIARVSHFLALQSNTFDRAPGNDRFASFVRIRPTTGRNAHDLDEVIDSEMVDVGKNVLNQPIANKLDQADRIWNSEKP